MATEGTNSHSADGMVHRKYLADMDPGFIISRASDCFRGNYVIKLFGNEKTSLADSYLALAVEPLKGRTLYRNAQSEFSILNGYTWKTPVSGPL